MTVEQLSARYDAVIIGSGHNGLIAAAYLAGAGQSVLVLERSDYLGGATVSQRVFPEFDACLSRYAYLVSLLSPVVLRDLGLDFQTRRRCTASFTPYQAADGTPRGLLFSNVDAQRSEASLRELTGSGQAWRCYQQFLELEREIAQLVWPTLYQPLETRAAFKQRLHSPLQREAWEGFVERPLGEILERYIDHDLVRGLLLTDAKIGVFTHPHDPSLLQNRCFLLHIVGNGTGEWRVPVGGVGRLIEELVNYGRQRHVTYLTGATATCVEPAREALQSGLPQPGTSESGGAEFGEATVTFQWRDGEQRVAARRVLINAGPRTFQRLLGIPWSAQPGDEGCAMKMNLLLERLPTPRARGVTARDAFAGSLHLNEGYQQMWESYERARLGIVPVPPPAEVYCHTLTDPTILARPLRDAGYHTLTLFGLDMPYRLFNGSEEEHVARRAAIQELYLESLDGICAGSFRECIARDASGQPCIEIKSPRDLEATLDLDQGNIFHKSPSWFFTEDVAAAGTWGVETAWPQIYRAGSSALRGGAISGIPGRNAAMCIFDELGISRPEA
jgi:phytoene dehydrogenase-like protein